MGTELSPGKPSAHVQAAATSATVRSAAAAGGKYDASKT